MDPSSDRSLHDALAAPARVLGEALGRSLAPEAIFHVYQPIVDLGAMAPVAYEALLRGPQDEELGSPLALLQAAREAGVLAEFDRASRDAALARAALAGVEPPLTVFVNVEPELLALEPDDRSETWVRAPQRLRCVIELTERDLTGSPAELLAAVAQVRELTWGVALDDVGTATAGLGLMALVRPDVVKLDLSITQAHDDPRVSDVVAAVNAHVEESGAALLAEGIETDEHLAAALAMGATLGQGYLLGRPASLGDALPRPAGEPVRMLGHPLSGTGPTPYALVRERQATRRGGERLLRTMTDHLAAQALAQGRNVVVLAARAPQRSEEASLDRLAALAGHAALVGLVGDVDEPRDGVHVARAAADDEIARETALVVLSPHFAAAIVARRIGHPDEAGEPGDHEFGVTYDRALVVACARALMARLTG